MESSQQPANDSFSYAWLINQTPATIAGDVDDDDETSSFFDVDPERWPGSRRPSCEAGRDFDFGLGAPPASPLLHADQHFSGLASPPRRPALLQRPPPPPPPPLPSTTAATTDPCQSQGCHNRLRRRPRCVPRTAVLRRCKEAAGDGEVAEGVEEGVEEVLGAVEAVVQVRPGLGEEAGGREGRSGDRELPGVVVDVGEDEQRLCRRRFASWGGGIGFQCGELHL